MKIEEAIGFLRKGIDVEFLNEKGDWTTLSLNIGWDIEFLMTKEFRVLNNKVKRYQVVFYDTHSGIFDVTINKWESQKNFEDNLPESWVFESLILKSEEEFDQ